MSTITETVAPTAQSGRHDRRDGRRRRREFTRAVALGATISALVIGGGWAPTSIGGSTHRAADNGAPTAGQSANQDSAGGSHSSAGGSHSGTGTGAATHQGASVVALQHELAQLNYYEGPIDGVLGLGADVEQRRHDSLWRHDSLRRHDDLGHRRHERRSVAPGIPRGMSVAVRPRRPPLSAHTGGAEASGGRP